MAEEGARTISPNFLAAHGLSSDVGWDGFSQDQSLVIVKLVEIEEVVGLKSPEAI
jgi:hypothetical protein